MLFKISGKHINVTEALKKYAREKTSRLPKFYNSINQIEVIIDGNQGSGVNVEIIARGEHSNVFVVRQEGNDAYKCMDLAARKLERQLRRKKGKERNSKHAV
ncbi:MAG: ribosome hibernation-promoting factor, HPF/YfiA family [Planctomycetota bacterium]